MFKQLSQDLFVNDDHVVAVRVVGNDALLIMIGGEVVSIPLSEKDTARSAALKFVSDVNKAKAVLLRAAHATTHGRWPS